MQYFLFNNYSGCVNQTHAFNTTIKSCPLILRVDDTCTLNHLNAIVLNNNFFIYKFFITCICHKFTSILGRIFLSDDVLCKNITNRNVQLIDRSTILYSFSI